MEEEFFNEDETSECTNLTINRSGIIIRAKQPLFDWLNTVEPGDRLLTDKDSSSQIYLIKESYDSEIKKWLKENYKEIFHQELYSWHTRTEDYPKKTNF